MLGKKNSKTMKKKEQQSIETQNICLMILLVILAVMLVFFGVYLSAYLGTFHGKGRSMEPTLHDNVIVYGSLEKVDRGDLVSCFLNEDGEYSNVIKRVIGIPGDHVIVTEEGVFVNGELLEEDYIAEDSVNVYPYAVPEYMDITLGENEYYVLGDNRSISSDSRIYGPSVPTWRYRMIVVSTERSAYSIVMIVSIYLAVSFGGLVICNLLAQKLGKTIDRKRQRKITAAM